MLVDAEGMRQFVDQDMNELIHRVLACLLGGVIVQIAVRRQVSSVVAPANDGPNVLRGGRFESEAFFDASS